MALTKSFREIVQARAARDPEFRGALLSEGIELLFNAEVEAGKAMLRDYINATIGFGPLAAAIGAPPKSLMRMFGPSGNPTAKNLMNVIAHLQRASGVSLEVRARA